jgi:glutamate synthase (ferredoxin)
MNSAIEHYKAQGVDLSNILYKPNVGEDVSLRNKTSQDHELDNVLDMTIVKEAKAAIEKLEKTSLSYSIKNTDRAVGAILSNEISKIHGSKGLPEDTLKLNFKGSAGQSFGAFATRGLTMKVDGNTNDYFGKGLSGATLIVKTPKEATFKAEDNIITGNVSLYGAINGEAYINGIAGERFCVRNSGATAVVEGVGDHCCEYMTGGVAVILGKTGRNFAAGMSGGIAYLYSEDGTFDDRNFNMEMIGLEDLSSNDKEQLKQLIENHVHHTESELGARILSDWDTSIKNFIKIMPTDYKRALARLEAEKLAETK